jgi:hypothetical protein
MQNNPNTRQSKFIIRIATYSLILGIISILLPYIIVIWQGTGVSYGSALLFLLSMIVAGTCAIVGLIFGIKGLNSTKRKLALAGIAVCAVSLLLWTWDLAGWLMMGGLTYL